MGIAHANSPSGLVTSARPPPDADRPHLNASARLIRQIFLKIGGCPSINRHRGAVFSAPDENNLGRNQLRFRESSVTDPAPILAIKPRGHRPDCIATPPLQWPGVAAPGPRGDSCGAGAVHNGAVCTARITGVPLVTAARSKSIFAPLNLAPLTAVRGLASYALRR